MIDKLYIVSIDWSEEHINSVLSVIEEVGIPPGIQWEVVGVNGHRLTNQDLIDRGITVYKDWNLSTGVVKLSDDENRFWHRDVTPGEIGCTLSHTDIWEDAYKNGYENILVYEDDIVFNSKMDWSLLDRVKKENYDLFYLGRLLQGGFDGVMDTPIDDDICIPGFSYQTHGYLLSKSGIKKLVEQHLPKYKSMFFVVDEFLASLYSWTPREELNDIFEKNLKTFALNEDVVVQYRTENYGNSLTQPKRNG